MSYRNKTYVIFDGDEDKWAYDFMRGWNQSEHIDFNFYDAHDLRPLRDTTGEETVKRRLRERMANTKQVIVIVGKKTKNLYRFVRWEIDIAITEDIPIVVVNLNGMREMDSELCPPILRTHLAMHVPFRAKIIKYALDNWPGSYRTHKDNGNSGPYYYKDFVYESLGLNDS